MSELTAEYFPQDTYHKSWGVFWLLAIASGIWLWLSFFRPIPVTEPPRAAISAGYDWFLILHMPEVPKDTARGQVYRQRFGEWLGALAQAGYQPMLLSDVEDRLARGVGLPRRAIVIVFDPGYYHTYDTLAPVMVQYRFPALWVTNHTAFLRGDRHFIHRHQAKQMIHSGYWDLGYSGDGFWRSKADVSQLRVNQKFPAGWVTESGRRALNWSGDFAHLNRLDISASWTSKELLDRLNMELPLQGTVHLGIQPMQGHLWGVVSDDPADNTLFTFKAPLSRTAGTVYWLGTRNVPDLALDVNIRSFFGECFLWMRSDVKAAQGVGIGFNHRSLYIDQKVGGKRLRLAHVAWKVPKEGLKGHIRLTGSHLVVSVEGAPPLQAELLPSDVSSQGVVRFQVYDHIRGAAQAEAVDLALTSLTLHPTR